MAVSSLRRAVHPGRLALLVARAGDHPRVKRLRAACHPVTHVVQSGAANGAINAYGWRGVAVVPVVLGVGLLLTRVLGRRTPA